VFFGRGMITHEMGTQRVTHLHTSGAGHGALLHDRTLHLHGHFQVLLGGKRRDRKLINLIKCSLI